MNSLIIFQTSVFVVLNLIMCYATIFAIRKKEFFCLFMFGSMFLICLIALAYEFDRIMVSPDTLLQIDATVIAGLLILLSITAFWGKTKEQNVVKTKLTKRVYIFWSPRQVFGLVVPFAGSSILIIINPTNGSFLTLLSIISTVLGFIFLIILAMMITFNEKVEPKEEGE